jgi:hydrogenase nickel incorporation protein HypB
MCEECGCGLPGETPVEIHAQRRENRPGRSHGQNQEHDLDPGDGLSHGHPHHHDGEDAAHEHVHSHTHTHDENSATLAASRRSLDLRRPILERNDRLAERNRGFFQARGLFSLNLLSAPGSGKTAFLRESLRCLDGKLKAGVVVGDLATENDAQRLRESGAPVVQITTGTVCHLDAEMVARAVRQLDLNGLHVVLIENVGNLVCPASYDLGEDLRVVLLSVAEGEDKPLKYPPIFQAAHVVVVTKMDLAQACNFDHDTALLNIRRVAPSARIFETSAKTGQGMAEWCDFLLDQQAQARARDPLLV